MNGLQPRKATAHLNLVPPLIEPGHVDEFIKSGQTLCATQSPLDNSLAVFVTSTKILQEIRQEKLQFSVEQPIYFAGTDEPPRAERRTFIVDTSLIFAAFQNMLRKTAAQPKEWHQNDHALEMIRKLGVDYANFAKECWVYASQPITRTEPLQFSPDHYRSLLTTTSLFVVLYLPVDGQENAPVGDELMEWLNTHFIEPSTEEGDHLSGLTRPWEDENFWPYLTRATLRGLSKASAFFLEVLSRHPSETLQELSQQLTPLLEDQPRLQNYKAEVEFVHAARRWRDKVKALRIEMDRVSEEERNDGYDNWWDRLSDIVGILEGREEVVQRVCAELGADWKEVCAAWGVFVNTRMRRQDVPDVAARVLEDMPPDPTDLEDMVHADLFDGKPTQALVHAAQLDTWLSAHLADIMAPLGLLDGIEDNESEMSTRDHYILTYAEHLHSDPSLWRITVPYMYSCGDIGKDRADEVILRVPLGLSNNSKKTTVGAVNGENGEIPGDLAGVLKDINETCHEHQREQVRRTVCRIAAQAFVRAKDYGLAVSYCSSAEDWRGLGRVVDRLLDEYITEGPELFSGYVATVAGSLQGLQRNDGPQGIFIHRLMFAVRYAAFHQSRLENNLSEAAMSLISIFSEDIAPKSWWGVLLCDSVALLQDSSTLFTYAGACEVLKKVDEVFTRAEQGSGKDYLSVLMRTSKSGDEKEALARLKAVRLALAKYFARI